METLPTPANLRLLPQRAIVAYAARCARRVQPLYKLRSDVANREFLVAAVDRAIAVAERFVESGSSKKARRKARVDATDALLAVNAAHDANAYAAAAAAVASHAAYAYAAPYVAADKTAAAVAATAAAATDGLSIPNLRETLVEAARRDFQILLGLKLAKPGEVGPPFPLSRLGPLWPNGSPFDRGTAMSSATVEPLTVFLDPGEAPQELLTDFFLALDGFYRASGGSGLQIVEDERRQLVGEEVVP